VAGSVFPVTRSPGEEHELGALRDDGLRGLAEDRGVDAAVRAAAVARHDEAPGSRVRGRRAEEQGSGERAGGEAGERGKAAHAEVRCRSCADGERLHRMG